MITAHHGSSMILALVCTAFMVMLCTNFWKTASLLSDLACKRESYEQRFRATEGLLNCGIASAQHNFTSTTLFFSAWPIGDQRVYEGRVEVAAKKDEAVVTAHLLHKQETVCSLRCVVQELHSDVSDSSEDKPSMRVMGWENVCL